MSPFVDTAYAASPEDLIGRINDAIVNPIIIVLFAVAFIYFLYGVLIFIKNAANETERAKGGKHIFWGIIGMAIMFGAKAIVLIIQNIVGG